MNSATPQAASASEALSASTEALSKQAADLQALWGRFPLAVSTRTRVRAAAVRTTQAAAVYAA